MNRRRFVQALASVALLPSLGWLGVKRPGRVSLPPFNSEEPFGFNYRYDALRMEWLSFEYKGKETPEVRQWLDRAAELVQPEVEKDMDEFMLFGSTRPRQ